jgi:hypothetical protein
MTQVLQAPESRLNLKRGTLYRTVNALAVVIWRRAHGSIGGTVSVSVRSVTRSGGWPRAAVIILRSLGAVRHGESRIVYIIPSSSEVVEEARRLGLAEFRRWFRRVAVGILTGG